MVFGFAEIDLLKKELEGKNEEITLLRKELLSLKLEKNETESKNGSTGHGRNSDDAVSKPAQDIEISRSQIEVGFQRRDPMRLKSAFDHHCDSNGTSISKDKLHDLLKELGLDITAVRTAELFDEFDNELHDGLEFEGLQQLLQKADRLYEWAQGLPLHELLADAIPRRAGCDPLRVVSELTAEEIATTCRAMVDGLIRIVHAASASLKLAFEASDGRAQSDGGSKFNIIPLSCGRITDFHAGIEERVGAWTCRYWCRIN